MIKTIATLLALVAASSALPRQYRNNVILIVGGEEAYPHEFPWHISMQYFGQHLCGGTIYNANTIITAAHCAIVAPANFLTVVAGKHNLRLAENLQQSRQVSEAIVHPNYPGATGFSNDIALLKLVSPLEYSRAVGPAPIAPAGYTATGVATITGWGHTTEDGDLSDTLQKVEIPIVSDAQCLAAFGSQYFDGSVMICAGVPEGGKDSCQYDSGGPFVVNDLGTGYYLAGVVSWGNGCARPGFPGVYTEVSHFTDFIRNNA